MNDGTDGEQDAADKALNVIGFWSTKMLEVPGFADWKKKDLGYLIMDGEPCRGDADAGIENFTLPLEMARITDPLSKFVQLYLTWRALADTEFYFRRYPFRDLQVTRAVHLRYTCENYFSRIYEFKERMSECLNAINIVLENKIKIGKITKMYKRDFDLELKNRNIIHHHNQFQETVLERMGLADLMGRSHHGDLERSVWQNMERKAYQDSKKYWVGRVKSTSKRMRVYLNFVAQLIVDRQEFQVTDNGE